MCFFKKKTFGLKKPLRPIDLLVIHCAATRPSMDVGVSDIRKWHINNGWYDIGYHFVIRRNGVLESGRPLDQIGAHVKGHNERSIGICLVGGVSQEDYRVPEDNFTKEQYATLRKFIKELRGFYPDVKIMGHNQLDRGKVCPSFYVPDWLEKEHL